MSPLRLYSLLLALYPRAFRERHAVEMWQTARDLAEARGPQNPIASAGFWLALYTDTLIAALVERGHVMRTSSWITWLVTGVTLLAVAVSIAASLNLYLLEDGNPSTISAYSVSSLLRFSYDSAYIAALVAGVAGFAVVVAAFSSAQIARWVVIGLAVFIALGGFGGLAFKQPQTGLAFIGLFAALTALCLLVGWGVARALNGRVRERTAALIGACAGAGVALLVEAAALITHTFALNPVSHALYMQARIGATPYNAALIGMAAQALLVLLCVALLTVALWSGLRRNGAASA